MKLPVVIHVYNAKDEFVKQVVVFTSKELHQLKTGFPNHKFKECRSRNYGWDVISFSILILLAIVGLFLFF